MSSAPVRANKIRKIVEPACQPVPELVGRQERGLGQAVAPQAAYRRVQLNRNGLRPADLLVLQRKVGNRGVQRMLAKQVEGAKDQQQDEAAYDSGPERESGMVVARAVQPDGGMHDSRPGPAPEAVVQRVLAAPAGATDNMAAIATHRNSIQDSGRTFHSEAEFLGLTAAVIEPKDDAFLTVYGAYVKATKGTDPVAARAAIDALVLAGNAKYAVFVAHVAALRAKYEDISDQLQEYVKGIPVSPGLDDKLMEETARKIRQMAFRADDAAFVRHLYDFQKWIEKETKEGYGYAYNDWLAAKAGEPEPLEAAAPAAQPGVMTVSQLRAVAPIGTTAGQRYTPNVAWHGTHTYHVSVSFSLDVSKANRKLKPPQRKLQITNFHVTYTNNANPDAPDAQKPRYWWRRTGAGTFVYDNASGPGHLAGMLPTAQAAVTATAAAIGCTA
jgi:hypothetical protein